LRVRRDRFARRPLRVESREGDGRSRSAIRDDLAALQDDESGRSATDGLGRRVDRRTSADRNRLSAWHKHLARHHVDAAWHPRHVSREIVARNTGRAQAHRLRGLSSSGARVRARHEAAVRVHERPAVEPVHAAKGALEVDSIEERVSNRGCGHVLHVLERRAAAHRARVERQRRGQSTAQFESAPKIVRRHEQRVRLHGGEAQQISRALAALGAEDRARPRGHTRDDVLGAEVQVVEDAGRDE